jgi:peptidase M28-like protein
MVCYRNLKLNPDMSSLQYAPKEVLKFWEIGRTIAPDVFDAQRIEAPIGDDQTALAAVGIPSFLVIDFKYAPWFNTTKDTLDKCSAKSLEAVGRTLLRYLYAP